MKKLLFSITKKDFDITYFSGKGGGGQHRNKHKNCVRLKHKDTGIITTGQDEKSLKQNLKNAFIRMTKHPEFNLYIKKRAAGEMLDEHEINKKVDEMMKEENLRIEYGV
jgi:protein subunit release factor A